MKIKTKESSIDPGSYECLAVALARIEAVLRAANREILEKAFPKQWGDGRRLAILEFCTEPKTPKEIREHIGSIAGYEIKDYLNEGLQSGVLACYETSDGTKYLTVLTPPGAKRKRKPVSKTAGRRKQQ